MYSNVSTLKLSKKSDLLSFRDTNSLAILDIGKLSVLSLWTCNNMQLRDRVVIGGAVVVSSSSALPNVELTGTT